MTEETRRLGRIPRGDQIGETFAAWCARTGTEAGFEPLVYPVPVDATWNGKSWCRPGFSWTPCLGAAEIASRWGMIEGQHHKQWVIDQMVRAVLGDAYAAWRAQEDAARAARGLDGWDDGIAP